MNNRALTDDEIADLGRGADDAARYLLAVPLEANEEASVRTLVLTCSRLFGEVKRLREGRE